MTLYHASQGVERIQKAIIELVCKKDHVKESEKESIYNLLMSHAHEGLNNWIESKEGISFNPRNLYKELTIRQNAKKELFYWLMKKAPDYPKYSLSSEDALKDALDFDTEMMEHYLCDLIFNAEDCQDYFGEVDCLYDELCSEDKEKWKKRIELIDYLIDRHSTSL